MLKDTSQGQPQGQILLAKAHKLAAAVYAVTGFMSDADPLKWNLRDKAMSLMSNIFIGHLETVPGLIDQIVSFIDIGLTSRLVSEMNFSVLRQEYLALRQNLAQPPPLLSEETRESAGRRGRASARPAAGSGGKKALTRLVSRQEAILAFIKSQPSRPATIKEILQAVPGQSSKTLQRDLKRLAAEGLIAKEGIRRWSRYKAL